MFLVYLYISRENEAFKVKILYIENKFKMLKKTWLRRIEYTSMLGAELCSPKLRMLKF